MTINRPLGVPCRSGGSRANEATDQSAELDPKLREFLDAAVVPAIVDAYFEELEKSAPGDGRTRPLDSP